MENIVSGSGNMMVPGGLMVGILSAILSGQIETNMTNAQVLASLIGVNGVPPPLDPTPK